ncbi:MAG: excisionase family DNA-binding protein [Desulfosporosinus sp.]|nr:excisionase family DNA-binding protein [Desulfosporosinus sp.]
MQAPKLLTIPEAAERLGVSDATVRRRIKDGSLKATKLPGPFETVLH